MAVNVLECGFTTAVPTSSVDFTIVQGAQNTATITIDVQSTGRYLVHLWLVDDNTDPTILTLLPPDQNGMKEWRVVTDADGTKDITLTHNGTVQSWYLCAAVLGVVSTPEAIDLGLTAP